MSPAASPEASPASFTISLTTVSLSVSDPESASASCAGYAFGAFGAFGGLGALTAGATGSSVSEPESSAAAYFGGGPAYFGGVPLVPCALPLGFLAVYGSGLVSTGAVSSSVPLSLASTGACFPAMGCGVPSTVLLSASLSESPESAGYIFFFDLIDFFWAAI